MFGFHTDQAVREKKEDLREENRVHSKVITICLCLLFGGVSYVWEKVAVAAAPEIKIAVVYPLSGALSRNGNLTLQGVKAVMGWVNDNGGIKSLGGAKLVPVVADSRSTVEGAASEKYRVWLDPEIVMSCGAWASSLTVAATETSKRLRIPHFSLSSADSLHERSFRQIGAEFLEGNICYAAFFRHKFMPKSELSGL